MEFLNRLRDRFHTMGLRQVWRLVVFVIGMTVLLLGIALLVLPGPAVVVIPAGLAILGLEFHWARRLLKEAKSLFQKGVDKVAGR